MEEGDSIPVLPSSIAEVGLRIQNSLNGRGLSFLPFQVIRMSFVI
jgi:hypothetical protein